ncbi:MAG: FAD-dependent oxidoreductase, partial [Pseudomonadota bacterium]|nr:FAD-dependent oxidoreductase [Pseudomonadota bacterium]
MSRYDYDIAIVGAGASGLIAADFAVKLGVRVLLIEKDRIGGDCTWTGCVPSKSLIKVASVAHAMRTAAIFGIVPSAPVVAMQQVREYLRKTIHQIYAPTTPEALRAKGMNVLLGAAQFIDPHTLMVNETRVTARRVLLNTGAVPRLPDVDGLANVRFVTYREIFENDTLPRTLLVIGGGPVGCEIAQCYRRLGAEVTLIAERLLPHEEPEASAALETVFEKEGIVRVRARATGAREADGRTTVATQTGEHSGDLLLVATGRRPQVDGLALDNAGIRFSEDGIVVDKYLRTTASHIFAAGDVTGGPQYSHLAGWQGFHAARNALLPGNSRGWSDATPAVTFTAPEIARAGLTEKAARERGEDVSAETLDLSKVDRAVSENDCIGFVKLIVRRNGHIAGATFVGERAGEAITELVLAMQRGLKV